MGDDYDRLSKLIDSYEHATNDSQDGECREVYKKVAHTIRYAVRAKLAGDKNEAERLRYALGRLVTDSECPQPPEYKSVYDALHNLLKRQ